MSAFFTNETISLEKQVEDRDYPLQVPREDFERVYEIPKCVKWIQDKHLKKVGVQFPDKSLPDAAKVVQLLQNQCDAQVYIMADTAYGSCCLDYVCAAHVDADAIIHFGPRCLSAPTEDLPHLFVYEKLPLDVQNLCEKIEEKFHNDLIILLDTSYCWLADALKTTLKNPLVKIVQIDEKRLEIANCPVVFIGYNPRIITNFSFAFEPKELFWLNPTHERAEIVNFHVDGKIRQRRHFLAEKIKDSRTIGIIIATVAVKNYLDVLHRLKTILRAYKKKYYVISVGKPTVAKLANFPELDVYVVIGCPLSDIYENRDFFRPIVTPYDVELSLNAAFSRHFSYDFNCYVDGGDFELTAHAHDVSLLTGRVRSNGAIDGDDEEREGGSGAVVEKNAGTMATTTSGAGFLNARTWHGLDAQLGECDATVVREGQKGIAQNYNHEPI